jgi:hypothetical protein
MYKYAYRTIGIHRSKMFDLYDKKGGKNKHMLINDAKKE